MFKETYQIQFVAGCMTCTHSIGGSPYDAEDTGIYCNCDQTAPIAPTNEMAEDEQIELALAFLDWQNEHEVYDCGICRHYNVCAETLKNVLGFTTEGTQNEQETVDESGIDNTQE
jgi:hypothetical protein